MRTIHCIKIPEPSVFVPEFKATTRFLKKEGILSDVLLDHTHARMLASNPPNLRSKTKRILDQKIQTRGAMKPTTFNRKPCTVHFAVHPACPFSWQSVKLALDPYAAKYGAVQLSFGIAFESFGLRTMVT
jgi:hypothetical protein